MNFSLLKISIVAMTTMASLHTHAQNKPFTINGRFDKDLQGKVSLFYTDTLGKIIEDSAKVVNGAFSFTATAAVYPSLAYMEFNMPKPLETVTKLRDWQELYVQNNTQYTINGDRLLSEAEILGGKAQADFAEYINLVKPTNKKIGEYNVKMSKLTENNDEAGVQQAIREAAPFHEQKRRLDSTYVLTHPDSYLALDMWDRAHPWLLSPEDEAEFKRFSPTLQKTKVGRKIANKISVTKRLMPGQTPPDFTLDDANGKPISLSALKGKNVLLFFWAPYVGPLLESTVMSMRRMQMRLKGKNLEILGVYYNHPSAAGSEDLNNWKSLIEENSMDWINVTDINGISETGPVSATAKAYGLNFDLLFQAHLIGPDGKIIARDVSIKDNQLASTIEKLIAP